MSRKKIKKAVYQKLKPEENLELVDKMMSQFYQYIKDNEKYLLGRTFRTAIMKFANRLDRPQDFFRISNLMIPNTIDKVITSKHLYDFTQYGI